MVICIYNVTIISQSSYCVCQTKQGHWTGKRKQVPTFKDLNSLPGTCIGQVNKCMNE